MQNKYNPFSTQELFFPEESRSMVEEYVQRGSKGGVDSPDKKPFRRSIDFWFYCVLFGVREIQMRPRDVPASTRQNSWHFNTGSIMEGDPSRIELLELIGIARSNDGYAIEDPSSIINYANGLARLGLPKLVTEIDKGSTPLEALLSFSNDAIANASEVE